MAAESLILAEEAQQARDEQQLSFFGSLQIPKADRSKPAGNYTGERLFRDRPETYRWIVGAMAEPGISIRQICRIAHVTDNTVQAVAAREGVPIAAHKKVILGTITHGLRLCAERVVELAPTMGAKEALVGVGILGEKMQLLSGGETARIAVEHSADSIFDRMAQLHAELRAASQMDLTGGNVGQKALGDSAKVIEAAAVVSDAESGDFVPSAKVIRNPGDDSGGNRGMMASGSGELPESGAGEVGGGGSAIAEGSESPTDRCSQNLINKQEGDA